MTTIKLNLKMWAKEIRKLGKGFNQAAKRGAKLAAARAVGTLQRTTSSLGVVNTGNYKRKWRWSTTSDGARVYNLAPYAGVLEYGRRVGRFPPIEPIRRWAMRKLGVSKKASKGVAFVIARAIAKRGLPGRSVLALTVPFIQQYFIEEVTREVKLALSGGGNRTP